MLKMRPMLRGTSLSAALLMRTRHTAAAAAALPRHLVRSNQTALAASRRHFRSTPSALHGDFEWEDPSSPEEVVRLIVIDRHGKRHEVAGKIGDNLLYVAHRWRKEQSPDLALEGACEASLACSTCHVIVRCWDALLELSRGARAWNSPAICIQASPACARPGRVDTFVRRRPSDRSHPITLTLSRNRVRRRRTCLTWRRA